LDTHTLFCGDLFTQWGDKHDVLTSEDILETSEIARGKMDYFAHGADTQRIMEHLASSQPTTLACMHGASWQGDGAALLGRLGQRLNMSSE